MRRRLLWLTVAAMAVMASCNPDEMIAPEREPEFLIQDGAHGGNSHFFFLPPLVPRSNYGGTPDGTLQPEVTVCELTGGASCGPIIARFTTEPGETLLERIRYDRFTGSYYLVWDTRKCLAGPCALDPAKRYRLRVSVAGSELGWADLDVVAKLRELTGVDWGTDVGVVRELPLPIRFRIEVGAIVLVNVRETLAVTDSPGITDQNPPPVIEPLSIAIDERIQVEDAVGILQPVAVTVREEIEVRDQIGLPPLEISVQEAVNVNDGKE